MDTFLHLCGNYVSYSNEELQIAIREMISELDSTVRVVGGARDRLLPLLEELKGRLPRGTWQLFLMEIGIRPCTLRKWRERARVDGQRMREVLFNEPVLRRPSMRTVKHESAEELLAQAAVRLANAVLNRDIRFAIKLAKEILESGAL